METQLVKGDDGQGYVPDTQTLSRHSVPTDPLLVNINTAAALLGIGRTKMFELIRAGAVETVQVGKVKQCKMSSIRHVAEHGVDPALLTKEKAA